MNEKRDHTIDILQDALKTAYSVPPIAPYLTTLMITSLVRVTHSWGLNNSWDVSYWGTTKKLCQVPIIKGLFSKIAYKICLLSTELPRYQLINQFAAIVDLSTYKSKTSWLILLASLLIFLVHGFLRLDCGETSYSSGEKKFTPYDIGPNMIERPI